MSKGKKSKNFDVMKFLRLAGTVLAYIVFWVPHFFWITYMLLGSFVFMTVFLTNTETIDIASILTFVGAFLLPTLAIPVGIYLSIKRKPRQMMALLFGVELPLFLLSIFRIFFYQTWSPPIALFLILIGLACFVLVLDMFDLKKFDKFKSLIDVLKVVGFTLGSLLSWYILLIWSFFAPAVFHGIYSLIQNGFQELFGPLSPTDFFAYLGIGLAFIAITLFLLLFMAPLYTFPIYAFKWVKTMACVVQEFVTKKDKKFKFHTLKAATVVKLLTPLVVLILVLGAFWAMDFDFSKKAKEDLAATVAEDGDFEELRPEYEVLMKKEKNTKRHIMNKYLSQFQYIFDDTSDEMFYDVYCQDEDSWGFSGSGEDTIQLPKSFCDGLYSGFSLLVAPVVYDGNIKNDTEAAEEEYKKVFDDYIQRGERDRIQSAMAKTFGDDEYGDFRTGWTSDTTTLLDEDERKVVLDEMTIKTVLNADDNLQSTEVVLKMTNDGYENEEVFIEFSVPDGSVVTDMALGPDLEHESLVAPNAAAEEVYSRSLVRSIDPALLEMVGPRTYRLRVYPIMPDWGTSNWSNEEVADHQKVMFRFDGRVNEDFEIVTLDYTRNLDITKVTEVTGTLYVVGESSDNIEVNFDREALDVASYDERVSSINVSGLDEEDADMYSWKAKSQKSIVDVVRKDAGVTITGQHKNLQVCPNTSKKTSEFMSARTATSFGPEDPTLVRVFVDVSKSADDKDTRKMYKEAISSIGDAFADSTIDVYEFNFDSNLVFEDLTRGELSEVQKWVESNLFWGYSDRSEIAGDLVISNPEGTETVTIVLTDDSDFEYTEDIDNDFDYSENTGNTIYLIQVGERLTAQKDEITNLVLASGGTVFLVESEDEAMELRQEFLDLYTDRSCSIGLDQSDDFWWEVVDDLNAPEVSHSAISGIFDSATRLNMARGMTLVSVRQHIVDPFNSFIAVETTWQEEQLEEASDDSDAYDQDYDQSEGTVVAPNNVTSWQPAPEADMIITIAFGVAAVGLGIVFEVRRRKKRIGQ